MADAINNELGQYWSLLNTEQKQSVLGLIKSFIKPSKTDLSKDIPSVVQEEVLERYERLKKDDSKGLTENEISDYLNS